MGLFFREVHPGSEMASHNDQNKKKGNFSIKTHPRRALRCDASEKRKTQTHTREVGNPRTIEVRGKDPALSLQRSEGRTLLHR